jgi:hypothetical protein
LLFDPLPQEERRLIEPLIVKEWDHCFHISKGGVTRADGAVALISPEQLAIELSDQPVQSITSTATNGGRLRGPAAAGPTLSLAPSHDGYWVHSGLWELNRPHELTAPVMADYTLAAEAVFQYFPLSDRLLQVREISSVGESVIRKAARDPGAGRLLQKSRRPRLDPRSWRWSQSSDEQGLGMLATGSSVLCDLLPGTLPLVEAIRRSFVMLETERGV